MKPVKNIWLKSVLINSQSHMETLVANSVQVALAIYNDWESALTLYLLMEVAKVSINRSQY